MFASLPVLLAVVLAAVTPPSAPAAASPPRARAPASRSSVAALVRRCVDAHGGQAALARSASAVHRGTVTSLLHPGVTGRIGRAYRRSGSLRVEIAFAGDPPELRILDAGRGWRFGQEVSGPLLAAMILQAARLDLPGLLSAWVDKVQELPALELGGRRLRVLSIEIAPGLHVEAAIDPATGRILRSRGASTGPSPVEFTTTYSDFRTVEGVVVPFREENWANGKTTGETVLEAVEFPPRLPDDLFRPDPRPTDR